MVAEPIQIPPELAAMVERVRRYVVDERGLLTSKEFARATKSYYRMLAFCEEHPELGLPPPPLMFWLDNLFPKLLVSDLICARAAWYGEEMAPAAVLMEREGMCSNVTLRPVPPGFVAKGRVGDIAVALGWLDKAALDKVLEVQRTIEKKIGVRLLLGTLMSARGDLDTTAFFQVLALQQGERFDRFDLDSLDRVKAAWLASVSRSPRSRSNRKPRTTKTKTKKKARKKKKRSP